MSEGDTHSRRGFLVASGAAASSALLAGCSGGDPETTETTADPTSSPSDAETSQPTDTATPEQEQRDKTYQLMTGGVRTLDPVQATDIPAGEVIHNLFDGLTNYPNGETTVETLIAKGYESANSGKKYTFNLKEGVTFINGDEVTAQDFVYSFNRLAESDNSNRKGFILGFLGVEHETKTVTNDKGESQEVYKPGTLGVKAIDDYTLEIKLEDPFHAVLELLAYNTFAAVPEGIVGDIEGYDGEMSQAEFSKNPVGSGPFELEKWKKDTELKLKARPVDEYHGPGPYISGVRWKAISGTNAQYTYATRNMNADYPVVPSAKYDESKVTIEGTDSRGREHGTYGPLANGIEADYFNLSILATYYFGFNCNNVIKPARQAWAYVYNRPQINEEVSTGPSEPAYFFTPPALFPDGPENYASMRDQWPYGAGETNIGKARKVMEEAGYSEDNMYEMTYTTADAAAYKKEGRIIRDRLKSAHIDLSVETDSLSTRFEKIANGNIDAYVLSWWADYPAADNFLQMLYPPNTNIENPDSKNGFNWTGTEASKKAKQAWEKIQQNSAATEADKKKRNEAYLEIEKARWEDVPVVTSNHYVVENYKYPWVNKPRSGSMGSTRQKYNKVRIEDRSKYK